MASPLLPVSAASRRAPGSARLALLFTLLDANSTSRQSRCRCFSNSARLKGWEHEEKEPKSSPAGGGFMPAPRGGGAGGFMPPRRFEPPPARPKRDNGSDLRPPPFAKNADSRNGQRADNRNASGRGFQARGDQSRWEKGPARQGKPPAGRESEKPAPAAKAAPVIAEVDDEESSFTDQRRSGQGKFAKMSGKERDREKMARSHEKRKGEKERSSGAKKKAKPAVLQKNIHLQDGISVANLSTLLGVPFNQLVWKMKDLGVDTTDADYVLHSEMASLIVLEYGFNPIVATISDVDLTARPEPEDWSEYPVRPPVVTIMGHVDHGKTTLLDSLRKTSVAAGEAGGITQHIGAFSVLLPSQKRITFLDTPGHAAFSAMRQRGAQTTDIVVLVVAADDGVMPQTVEAIKHSQTAGVPIVVAINKCDKPDANVRKLKEGLLRYDVVLEEFGGEIPAVEVSGLTGKGLDELEETIVTMAEVMDIRGDPNGPVEGVVIESKLVRGKGNVATLMIRRGTLTPGDVVVAGNTWSKVRIMHDEHGVDVKKAGPSTPVEVMGWKDLPAAGDLVFGLDAGVAEGIVGPARKASDVPKNILEAAKKVVQARIERARREASIEDIKLLNEKRLKEKQERADAKAEEAGEPTSADTMTEEEVEAEAKDVAASGLPVLNVVLKSDVHGSLEALTDAINGLPAHQVRVCIVKSGVGPVTDSDVDSASAAKAEIITFNIPIDKRTSQYAVTSGVTLRPHTIIYKLLDELKEIMGDLLPPEIITEVNGEAEILQVFGINVKGKQIEKIAGCRVATGKVTRANSIRITRKGEVVYDGRLKTFKHHKKDINEASKGLECGMGFERFDALEEGDIIQAYTTIQRKRKIT
ncbi:uncharacterized protein EV422DRAFT_137193 [Fimicolochytrium jonesii]|uniref:uncharacterized protein n=1 Tax=Fimicolochytrium jonesii TaxID=1396493 RepID=UPI0022FDDB52|nr:uncharacterized protein EV422DRAFT_137193 [Fimicolochytrium jonesii]KAI8825695.1 hypothetical protein EV422DRAFT_137193 [Fimicolochytrium jonesii]